MQPSYLCCHWTAGKICHRPPSDIQRLLSDFCHNRVLVQWTLFTRCNPKGVRKCKISSQIVMRPGKLTWSRLYTGLGSQSWVPSGTVFAKNSSMGSFCNCCNVNDGKNRVSPFRKSKDFILELWAFIYNQSNSWGTWRYTLTLMSEFLLIPK